MLQQTQQTPVTVDLRGDLHPLLDQIGSPDGLAALAETAGAFLPRQIATASDLRIFLEGYRTQVLQPLELPAIQRAYHHASRNELRELIAFDRELADQTVLKNFASASRLVGLGQLQRLRPLRDVRMAQRYLAAVEKGEANGWHTVVYGLILSVYSFPLRQGLLGYAGQTTQGFLQAAGRSLSLSEKTVDDLLAEISHKFPAAVEALVAQKFPA